MDKLALGKIISSAVSYYNSLFTRGGYERWIPLDIFLVISTVLENNILININYNNQNTQYLITKYNYIIM